MTNQTIPPCPVCGKVPEINEEKIYCNCPHNCGEYETRIDVVQTCDCEHFCYPIYPANAGNSLYTWVDTVETLLGRACRELDIETVEQLKTRLAPDPRVAVLEIALTKVAESDLSQVPYSQIKAHIEEALFRSQFIAAQRGEVGV